MQLMIAAAPPLRQMACGAQLPIANAAYRIENGVLCALPMPPALRGGRAAAVALVAKQMAERGEAVLPEALLPDYHRLSQAERERAERLAAEAAQNVKTDNGKD